MTAIQFICAKIWMVSGIGLSGVLRKYYPRWLVVSAIVLLVVANTINAGTDIEAMAASINLLAPSIPPLALVVPIAIVIVAVQIFGSYRTLVKIFKWLMLMLLAYIAAAFLARPHCGDMLICTFLPLLRLE